MDTGLNGKRALVLGSSRGLGFAIAEGLSREGATVVVTARDQEVAIATAGRLGTGAFGFACDTGKTADIDALHAAVTKRLGGIDILVLNTGGPIPSTARNVSSEQWRASFESMFVNLVRLTDLVMDKMVEGKFGRVIMVVSSGVIQPIPNLAISNSIRAALIGWGKTLAGEVAAHGVTVNAIAPGRIATDRLSELNAATAQRTGRTLSQIQDAAKASIPAGRLGDPKEFAAAAVFLASEAASYVTGSIMRVDGGAISSH